MQVKKFESKFNLEFNNKNLLIQAFTHSSYVNEHRQKKLIDNERLEFLGDAVLELGVSEYLYNKHVEMSEGEMTKLRATIVCEESLYYFSNILNFNEFILLGKGEEQTGGRDRQALLADVFEAFLGALFIDQGYKEVIKFLNHFVFPNIMTGAFSYAMDYKSELQELIQRRKKFKLNYDIIEERGPSHSKEFVAEVKVDNEISKIGIGKTKKEAEQRAAQNMLTELNQNG
ncbi:MAG TPA: ribonuclease III [Pseudogracilibacillus sp.]|nr:ribonuclease III [Pseudogracilibacillus sp.]